MTYLDKDPKMLTYCQTVYDTMAEGAEDYLWKGYVKDIMTSTGIPKNQWSFLVRALEGMGSGMQVARGSGKAMSVWKLGLRPTIDTYRAYQREEKHTRARRMYTTAEVMQMLSAQAGDIEQLKVTVKDQGKRIKDLEEKSVFIE